MQNLEHENGSSVQSHDRRRSAHRHVIAMASAAAIVFGLVVVLACEGRQQPRSPQQGESAQQPSQGQPSSGSACHKDADCKGERVCIQRECRTPR